jgi:LacI family transcriptional regulator
MLAKHRVDGVIAFASHVAEADLVAIYEQLHTPVVVINRRINHAQIPCIVVDFEDAAYRSARHLLGLKHTRIGYLAGLPTSETSQLRRNGIERALSEAGLHLPNKWYLNCFPSIEGGFQGMSALLALPQTERPTAVITYNDLLAFGALHALRVHGLSTPEDMSVVGCDNIALSAHSNPPLTTIEQPKYRMGRLAMQSLNKLMHRSVNLNINLGHGYTLMESPLIIRDSTAVAR